jgi:hypothetical protein
MFPGKVMGGRHCRPPILVQRDRERAPRASAPAAAVSALPPLLPVLDVAAEALPAPVVVEPELLPVVLSVLIPLLDPIEPPPGPLMPDSDWPPIWPVCPAWPLICPLWAVRD